VDGSANQGVKSKSQHARVAQQVLDLIGMTPVVKLNRLVRPEWAEVYVKLEKMNPGGSVKDRTAYNMIRDAEEKGLLKPGATIIEPTSGNTGIGLALVGAARGYRTILVVKRVWRRSSVDARERTDAGCDQKSGRAGGIDPWFVYAITI
jgi:cysteine synthase